MAAVARLARIVARGTRDAVGTGMLVSAIGCLLLLVQGTIGGSATAWVEAIAWATGAGALAGGVLVPCAVAWRWVAPKFARADAPSRTVGLALALVVVEIGVALAASGWARRHATADAMLALVVTSVLAGLVAALGARSARHPLVRGTARLAPGVTPLVLWATLPEHVKAHAGVDWACALAAVLPYAAAVPSRRGGRIVGIAAVVVTVPWLAVRYGRRPALRAAVERDHALVRRVVDVAGGSFDFDDDGASAWFGGGDCAPFDAAAGPGRAELAGNGIDDNCIAGDLADDRLPVVSPSPVAAPPRRPRNVLVICVDAMRPDRMSLYGYERATTPRLDAELRDAFVFDRAYSEAASTRDTIPSLLSGRRRFELWWYRHRNATLDPRERLLTHHLADAGWTTIAVVPFVAVNMMGTARLGFSDLQIVDDRIPRSAETVTDRLLAAIDRADAPFFAYAHYYEPHEPYVRHASAREVSPEPYDQEIHAVDRAIGRLWEQLRTRGRLDDTLIVVTSDHGEAFGEHGHAMHNAGAYEEDLRVPLAVRVPGVRGRRIPVAVSNTAIAATILDLIDVAPPPVGPTVPSLWPRMAGVGDAPEPILSVARPDLDHERFAYVEGQHKVLFDRTLSSLEVYDLAADPGETRNILGDDPATAGPVVEHAAITFDRVVGGAQSRRRTAMIAAAPAADAIALDVEIGAGVRAEAAVAWTVDSPERIPRMARRVLVRVWFRRTEAAAGDLAYRVAIEGGTGRGLHADGPAWRGLYTASAWTAGDLVEDTRVFKVYPRDAEAHVVVEIAGTEVDLGVVSALAVAPGDPQ